MTEREIFAEALLCPTKVSRAAFLDKVCGTAGPLRERIEELLAMHESDSGLLEQRAAELLATLGEDRIKRDPEVDLETVTRQLVAFLAPATRPGALGRLDHYEVLHVLGFGGYGIVVKAYDDSLERIVAIKILAPHLAASSPPRKRFLREARSAASVKHEHVVQIHAVEEQPLPYLVMEFIEGQTLQQKIDAEGPLEAAEVIRLGQQIALGLAAAHDKGLIHRDVKPANILLEAGVETRVKLTDFGLARTSDDASLTQSGTVAGSPMYMAPEQIRGARLDHRTDLFSFGSVLYTMLAGRPPFRAPDTLAILNRVADETPRPIREVIPEAPAGLCAVIARLQQKDPAQRFESASQVARILSTCLTARVPMSSRRRLALGRLAGATMIFLLTAFGIWLAPVIHPRRAEGSKVQPNTKVRPDMTEPAVPAVGPAKLIVTSILDDGTPGSLRWAIAEANLRHGEDKVTFDSAVFSTPRTINLTEPLVLFDSAQTTIVGPTGPLTLSGNDKHQVFVIGAGFDLNSPARALIAHVTIAHGRAPEELNVGGGVLVRGGSTLTLTGCTLRDNSAMRHESGGGAIFSGDSTLIVHNCTFTRNEGFEGGAIKNYAGVAKVANCTFVGNSATRDGGAIFTNGYLRARTEVYNSLFQKNQHNDLILGDGKELTGDYNLTGDFSAPGPNSFRATGAKLGPLDYYGGPTETFPLLTASPGINQGNNERVPKDVTTDQRGLARIANGKVDLGAFEAQ